MEKQKGWYVQDHATHGIKAWRPTDKKHCSFKPAGWQPADETHKTIKHGMKTQKTDRHKALQLLFHKFMEKQKRMKRPRPHSTQNEDTNANGHEGNEWRNEWRNGRITLFYKYLFPNRHNFCIFTTWAATMKCNGVSLVTILSLTTNPSGSLKLQNWI